MPLDSTFWNSETLRLIALKSRTDGGTLREWRVGARQAGATETNLTSPASDSWQGVIFQNANIAHRGVRAVAATGWKLVQFELDTSPTIYVDGATTSIGSDGPNGSKASDGTGSLFIGGWDQETARGWRGVLGPLAIFDKVLTSTEHADIWAARTSLSAYNAAVLAESPVAYWTMQESGGNLADSSGNGHTAVLDSGTPTYRAPGPMPGARGISLSGSGQWWKVADNAAWSAAAVTVLAWVWATAPQPAVRGRRGLGLVRG